MLKVRSPIELRIQPVPAEHDLLCDNRIPRVIVSRQIPHTYRRQETKSG